MRESWRAVGTFHVERYRLTDLRPRWGIDADIVIGGVLRHDENRHGMAVTFDCPHCMKCPTCADLATYQTPDGRLWCSRAHSWRAQRLGVWFANPIDGLPPTDDAERLWQRTGDTFETLSLSPSIDASARGHWHGCITDGEVM